MTHRAAAPTNGAGMAHMTTTGRRLWVALDARVEKRDCAPSPVPVLDGVAHHTDPVSRPSAFVTGRSVLGTDRETLENHVHRYTMPGSWAYTDEWQAYNHIVRLHATVCHSEKEWARDDDGDGVREVHVNTAEGMWTDVRNFLRPFKGVHKRYLGQYVAMAEFRRNLKRVSPAFISSIVTFVLVSDTLNTERHFRLALNDENRPKTLNHRVFRPSAAFSVT